MLHADPGVDPERMVVGSMGDAKIMSFELQRKGRLVNTVMLRRS